MRQVKKVPGLLLAGVVAAVATVAGGWFPVVGGPVFGVVIGVLVAAVRRPGARFQPGIATASRFVLQLAVVILGCQLSLARVVEVGGGSLPVMVGSLAACLGAAYLVGRRLGIGGDLRTLIGVGTGICGASAIAAVTPVIGAAGAEVAYAISTIFLFNIAAVLLFPFLGHLLGMGQHAFGLFAGTAVNDMSSVVASATTYGDEAGQYAVVVKLTRTLLIIPICLGLAALARRRAAATAAAPARPARATAAAHPAQATAPAHPAPAAAPAPRPQAAASAQEARSAQATHPAPPAHTTHRSRHTPGTARANVFALVPWFLVGFLLTALANTVGLVPAAAHHGLNTLSVFLITVALSAIGLSTDLGALRRAGPRPLLLGAVLWGVVTVTSLCLQFLTASW
ncbi:YeiH family protein [Streptomyces sp. NRRL S-340]|uniref:YeiH family protein n=1 Tax=Streptomyces sp. NRRL S-340 TaxID=1463901 RepID=UPI00055B6936|nr:putative sulfate exporter family transporter [Streptomyces sp. NRRL S-340]